MRNFVLWVRGKRICFEGSESVIGLASLAAVKAVSQAKLLGGGEKFRIQQKRIFRSLLRDENSFRGFRSFNRSRKRKIFYYWIEWSVKMSSIHWTNSSNWNGSKVDGRLTTGCVLLLKHKTIKHTQLKLNIIVLKTKLSLLLIALLKSLLKFSLLLTWVWLIRVGESPHFQIQIQFPMRQNCTLFMQARSSSGLQPIIGKRPLTAYLWVWINEVYETENIVPTSLLFAIKSGSSCNKMDCEFNCFSFCFYPMYYVKWSIFG